VRDPSYPSRSSASRTSSDFFILPLLDNTAHHETKSGCTNAASPISPAQRLTPVTMAKKRKASRKAEPTGPREVDAKDASLTVRTYKDVANSEDEFYAEKDRIDFESDDGGRESKRRRRQEKEDEFLEASDEEVFAEDDSDEEEEVKAPKKKKSAKAAVISDDEMEAQDEEGEGDDGWWGTSKKEYYDADNIETEADALVRFGGLGGLGCIDANEPCRRKRRRRGDSRRRSWPRWRRLTLPLTRVIGWPRKRKPERKRRS